MELKPTMRTKPSTQFILMALLSLFIAGCFPYAGDVYQAPEINGRVIFIDDLAPVKNLKAQHYGFNDSTVTTGANGEFTLAPVSEVGVSVMMVGFVLSNFYIELTPPKLSNLSQSTHKALLFPVRAHVKLDHYDHVQTDILFDPKTAAGEFATVTSKSGAVIDLNQWYQKINSDPLFEGCDSNQAFSTAMLLSNQQKLRRIITENPEKTDEYQQYEEAYIEQLYSFDEGLLYSCRTEQYHELNDREKDRLRRAWYNTISPVFDHVQ
jgi:hypothetical protein